MLSAAFSKFNGNTFLFLQLFRLFTSNEADDDDEDDDEELRQRRYSLQLNDSRGYRRGKKLSTQPQLDSEDEVEQIAAELLSRQNTM